MEVNKGLAKYTRRSKAYVVRKVASRHDWKKRQAQIGIVMPQLMNSVTEARMHNVMSHDGLSDPDDIIGPDVDDVFKDYSQDHGDVWEELDDMTKGILKKKMYRSSLPKIKTWIS